MPKGLQTMLIVVVAVVWAANFTAPIFVHDYKPEPELNVAFMAIIGVLTAGYNRTNRTRPKNPKDKPGEDDEDTKEVGTGDRREDQ